MSKKTIVLIIIIFTVISIGMVWYAALRSAELSDHQTLRLDEITDSTDYEI